MGQIENRKTLKHTESLCEHDMGGERGTCRLPSFLQGEHRLMIHVLWYRRRTNELTNDSSNILSPHLRSSRSS